MCISLSESKCENERRKPTINAIFDGFNENCGDFVTVNFLDRT